MGGRGSRSLALRGARRRAGIRAALVDIPFETAEEYAASFENHYGPTLKAKQALEPEGKWDELRDEWLQLVERFIEPGRGVVQDYWVITGRRDDARSYREVD